MLTRRGHESSVQQQAARSRGRRNGRPEILPPIDRRDCLRERLRRAGEPATSVRVYLTCGLKSPCRWFDSAPVHHELREILEDASAPCRRPYRRIRSTTAARWWRPSSALSAPQRRGVDEAFLVVTLAPLEVVDLSMASPAPIEAPVQRGGFI